MRRGAFTFWIGSTLAILVSGLEAQSNGYPTPPKPLPEADEIALAMSAAPKEISSKATIYVLRAGGPQKAREGTNGCTCMVSRDLHAGSLYPICFDQEGSRTLLDRELMELRLRLEGKSEAEVKQAVASAYTKGILKPPARTAIAYMMSSRQVLFSSPLPEGRKVGAWHPHIMISVPNATETQFGMPEGGMESIQLERSGEPMAQLIVKVPQWADGPRVSPPPRPDAASPASVPPAVRESLRQAEYRLSNLAGKAGIAHAIAGEMAPDAVAILDGAPIVRGQEAAAKLLDTQPWAGGAQLTWIPLRVILSQDQRVGVSFGAAFYEPKQEPSAVGRYLMVWRKNDAGEWKLAVFLQNGAMGSAPGALPQGLTRAAAPEPSDPYSAADRAFSRMAGDSGAPAAFARFIAPDGITFAAGGEINVGPAGVRSRMLEGRAAQAAWKWAPVLALTSDSGDLGVTVGEAEIRPPEGGQPNLSKYVTVWQRQPDGSLKFVVDAGNSRPPSP